MNSRDARIVSTLCQCYFSWNFSAQVEIFANCDSCSRIIPSINVG